MTGTMMPVPENLSTMWPKAEAWLERELGQTLRSPRLLSTPWSTRATWAVSTPRLGDLVVKIRNGDRAAEKTRWAAANLPLLTARGCPAPTIVWHGPLDEHWHISVQHRLPGRSPRSLTWPLLNHLVELVDLRRTPTRF
jgi:hypothetical protein